MNQSNSIKNFKLKLFLTKWANYEYWPWLFFYLPTVPLHLWYALRSGYMFFNTAANPGIDKGGLFGESKIDILDNFSDEFKPKTYSHRAEDSVRDTLNYIHFKGFELPLIVKPNVGERGASVEKVNDFESVEKILSTNPVDFIIQEFVNYPLEFGVLYGRLPNEEKGSVRSVTIKGFLSVTGDGKSTVYQLLLKNKRAWFQLERLNTEKPQLLAQVPQVGETMVVEPIGNHCRGTEFINGNHLLCPELDRVFDKIAGQFEGFYYGRFDLKAKSEEALIKGESIRIFELNGVTSEAGHIYDKNHTLVKAYRDIYKEMDFSFRVSLQNIKKGVKPQSIAFVLKLLYSHFKNKN